MASILTAHYLLGLAEQYRKVTTYKYTLPTQEGDNCVQVGDAIALIKNIMKEQIFVIYQNFRRQESYFSYPCMSSFIGCYKVWQLHDNFDAGRLALIQNECVLSPDKHGYITMSMPHMK